MAGRNPAGQMTVIVLAGLGLAGCVIAPGTAGVSGHYLGYVRLQGDPAATGGRVSDVETVGAWLEQGSHGAAGSLGLGFRRAEQVVVPLDCRIAVIVRSDAQMAEARALVHSLEGRQACAVNAATR